MKDIVNKVVKNNNCVGCGLCMKMFNNSYAMQLTEDGFFRPKKIKEISERSKEEEFKKICPGYIRNMESLEKDKMSIWGKYENILTTYSSDSDIRFKAATGGSLTSILLYLLEKKKIDGVLQVKANSGKKYMAQYTISKNKEEILESMGSRYQPCFMFSKLDEIENFKGKLAIVGKPCDIATLKRYAQIYGIENKIFCYITFLCGGTPSLNATIDILKENNIDKDNISELRYRGEGWPGYFKVKQGEKEILKISYVDSWAKKLSRKVQKSCRICTEGVGDSADIVFGDAWNLHENGKINFEESDGVNITIARNKKGKAIIEEAIKDGYLNVVDKKIDESILNKMQPVQAMHRRLVYYKILGKKISLKKVPKFNKKVFKNFAKEEKFIKKVKTILSSVKKEIK